MSSDASRCVALRSTIRVRLEACDEAELDALERMLTAIEERRDILMTVKFAPVIEDWPPRSRGEEIITASRSSRNAEPVVPRRAFGVIQGGLSERDYDELRAAGVRVVEEDE